MEAGRRVGGPIRSARVQGYLCEDGPTGFLNRDPSTLALARRVGLESAVVCANEGLRRRFILKDGELCRFPDSPRNFFASALLSVRARVRALAEPMVPPAPQGLEETVAQFGRRRFGKEAAGLLIDPMVTGIYAGDPTRLSAPAALPQLCHLDRAGKSVLASLLRSRQRLKGTSNAAVTRQKMVSFHEGLGQLVEATAASLGERVRLHSPVTALHRDGERWRVQVGGPKSPGELLADVVVSAAPARAAGRYLQPVAPEAAEACAAIPYAPIATVLLGYLEAEVPHPLDGFGYLVAGNEPTPVLGVYWSTSMFEGRAPAGKVALHAILGGARHPHINEASDNHLLDLTAAHLRRVLGIEAAPVFTRITRHRLGLPQYETGHQSRVATIAAAEQGGLFITGNAYRGVGINASTADAERTAARVAAHLGQRRRLSLAG